MNKQPGFSLRKAFKIKARDVSDFKNRDRIGGDNFDDLYRFKVKSSSNGLTQVDIDLSKLKQNADLELYALKRDAKKVNKAIGKFEFSQIKSKKLNKNLVAVASSTKKGKKKSESISTQLEAGTYYIRVFSKSTKTTRYKLELATEPVNTPPAIEVKPGSVAKGDAITIIEGFLKATDQEDNNQSLRYTLTSIPEGGRLELNGNTLSVGAQFTQADISSGRLSYSNLGLGRITQVTNNNVNDVASGVSGFNVVFNQINFAGDTQDITDPDQLNQIAYDLSRDVYLYDVKQDRLVRVTNNNLPDFPVGISGSNIVGNTLEIFEGLPIAPSPFFYNGSSGQLIDLRVVSDNEQSDSLLGPILKALNSLGNPPSISESTIVWSQFEPVGDNVLLINPFEIDFEIFSYDISSGETTQITNDTVSQVPVGISGANIVFQSIDFLSGLNPFFPQDPVSDSDLLAASTPIDVFWYNSETKQITQLSQNTTRNEAIGISETKIAWSGFDGNDTEIFMYDIATQTTTQVTNNNVNETIIDSETGVQIANLSGNNLVWSRIENGDAEIFLYDGVSDITQQITNNSVKDIPLGISESNVVWSSFDNNGKVNEVFFYDGTTGKVTQVTNNNESNFAAGISGDKIVWNAFDGNDTEVFFADLGDVPTSDFFQFRVTDSQGASTNGTFSINVT